MKFLRRPREPLLLGLVALFAAAYAVFSLVRWSHLGTSGFDLGIFDQTVWRYSRFELPENSIRGFDNIWADHFSPILMLLAPLYWVWEDARMLLLAQAVLLAAAAVPIFLFARDRLGRLPAYLFALAYLVFWGVQSALDTDFHENAFVPVLIASLLLAVQRRNWKLYFALLVALLCVKEDQSIVAVFIGLYLLTFRAWRQGLATIAIGVAWYVLVVKLLIPGFNPTDEYAYFNYDKFGDDPLSAIGGALTDPGLVVSTLFDHPEKRQTLEALFVPFLGLTFCSRTAILLLPLVAQRFLSDVPAYWSIGGQYTLPMMAILFVGAADGLGNLWRLVPRPRLAAGVALAVLVLNVAYMVKSSRGIADLPTAALYRDPPGLDDALAAIAAVPDDVSVATTDNVISRLGHREVAAEISPQTGETDYVLANVLDVNANLAANSGFAVVSGYVNRALATHDPAGYFGGWLLLRHRRLGPAPRPPELAPPAGAAALRESTEDWLRELTAYRERLTDCQADADPPGCLRSLERRRFLARGRALREGLDPAGMASGCAQLAQVADLAVTRLTGSLEGARVAGAEGDQAALGARFVELKRLADVDAEGAVARFAALCAPA